MMTHVDRGRCIGECNAPARVGRYVSVYLLFASFADNAARSQRGPRQSQLLEQLDNRQGDVVITSTYYYSTFNENASKCTIFVGTVFFFGFRTHSQERVELTS